MTPNGHRRCCHEKNTPALRPGFLADYLLLVRRTRRSADHFNVRQFPALVENRLLRAIHAEPREPFLTGLGVKPVGLLTGGGGRGQGGGPRPPGRLAALLAGGP